MQQQTAEEDGINLPPYLRHVADYLANLRVQLYMKLFNSKVMHLQTT